MTEKELRQKVVDTAVSYLGCKEANGSHRKIIDLYNSHKPLARGYAVKYTDAWCSTFASAVAIACGLTDIIPTECGCERHIDLFKKLGSWVENDAYVPSPGDYIFYDWQDGSNYATTNNTGSADHVGIVVLNFPYFRFWHSVLQFPHLLLWLPARNYIPISTRRSLQGSSGASRILSFFSLL